MSARRSGGRGIAMIQAPPVPAVVASMARDPRSRRRSAATRQNRSRVTAVPPGGSIGCGTRFFTGGSDCRYAKRSLDVSIGEGAEHRLRHRRQQRPSFALMPPGLHRRDEHLLGPLAEPSLRIGREVCGEAHTPWTRQTRCWWTRRSMPTRRAGSVGAGGITMSAGWPVSARDMSGAGPFGPDLPGRVAVVAAHGAHEVRAAFDRSAAVGERWLTRRPSGVHAGASPVSVGRAASVSATKYQSAASCGPIGRLRMLLECSELRLTETLNVPYAHPDGTLRNLKCFLTAAILLDAPMIDRQLAGFLQEGLEHSHRHARRATAAVGARAAAVSGRGRRAAPRRLRAGGGGQRDYCRISSRTVSAAVVFAPADRRSRLPGQRRRRRAFDLPATANERAFVRRSGGIHAAARTHRDPSRDVASLGDVAGGGDPAQGHGGLRSDAGTAGGSAARMKAPLESLATASRDCCPRSSSPARSDGVPNAAYLSHVDYVDPEHVALSFQFFNKSRRNIAENPQALVILIDPDTGQGWSLRLRYVRSETSGPLFERMALRIEAIASYCGLKGIFKLRAADVYEVLDDRAGS